MSHRPKISVVMAAYNAEQFVGEAIRSILGQSFRDFELLVVNDGSQDRTGAILDRVSHVDSRVQVITQSNAGLASARNTALARARGEFVAIADADDIQFADRFEVLVGAFQADPRLDVCGGGVESWLGGNSPGTMHMMPTTDGGIRAGMVFESMMFDPTVIYRRAFVEPPHGGYDTTFHIAVDYDLWTRLLPRARFGNVPRPLTRYRRHDEQITNAARHSGRSLSERQRIWSRVLHTGLGIAPEPADLLAHELAATWGSRFTAAQRASVSMWLERLCDANRTRRALPPREFEEQLARRWIWICRHTADSGLANLSSYWRSSLARLGGVTGRSRLGLFWHCLKRTHKLPQQ